VREHARVGDHPFVQVTTEPNRHLGNV
jgi:hypothetical protein